LCTLKRSLTVFFLLNIVNLVVCIEEKS